MEKKSTRMRTTGQKRNDYDDDGDTWYEGVYYGEEDYEEDERYEPSAEEASNAVVEYDEGYSDYMDARRRMNELCLAR